MLSPTSINNPLKSANTYFSINNPWNYCWCSSLLAIINQNDPTQWASIKKRINSLTILIMFAPFIFSRNFKILPNRSNLGVFRNWSSFKLDFASAEFGKRNNKVSKGNVANMSTQNHNDKYLFTISSCFITNLLLKSMYPVKKLRMISSAKQISINRSRLVRKLPEESKSNPISIGNITTLKITNRIIIISHLLLKLELGKIIYLFTF